jgi:4-nitrophenyl phosphatase
LVIGKPKTIMGDTLKERFNAGSKKFLMVGDRLDTDICFGLNNEFNTMLVLSGETTMEHVQKYPRQPDFILDSLNDIKNYF